VEVDGTWYADTMSCCAQPLTLELTDCVETIWDGITMYAEHWCMPSDFALVATPECVVEGFCQAITSATSAFTNVTEGDCRSEDGTNSLYNAGLEMASLDDPTGDESSLVGYLYYSWCYDMREGGTLPDPIEISPPGLLYSGDPGVYECPITDPPVSYVPGAGIPIEHSRVLTPECVVEGFCLELNGLSSPYTAGADADCESGYLAATKADGATLATLVSAADGSADLSVLVDSLNNAWCTESGLGS
jgi:hypothetical protein